MTTQLIEAPTSDTNYRYESLAYADAYDAVLNCDYAFVAYKETNSSGVSCVRIRSSQTAGAVFEIAAMRSKARETGAQGKPWFQWGYSFDPSPSDPRNIQFRVHVANGQPAEIEILVQLRKADGSADDAQVRALCLAGDVRSRETNIPVCFIGRTLQAGMPVSLSGGNALITFLAPTSSRPFLLLTPYSS